MRHLRLEELEPRVLLAADVVMAATGLTTNSVADFYFSQTGVMEVGAPVTDMTDAGFAAALNGVRFNNVPVGTSNPAESPDATTGVGQMVITTGANTLGISSFASPVAGPSRAGGSGDISVPIEELPTYKDRGDSSILADPDASLDETVRTGAIEGQVHEQAGDSPAADAITHPVRASERDR